MTIAELISGLPVRLARGDAAAVDVRDMAEDSRDVGAGFLFVARTGVHHEGRRFIADAIKRGAAAVLTERDVDVPQSVVVLLAEDVALAEALLAERLFGAPSSRLTLIGVTGTNAKTTITWLVRHLLNQAGIRCGLIGTVQIDDGRSVVPASLTTPASIDISRQLARMAAHGCRACVMECSSHAMQQQRTAGLRFATGVFTNLTGDHLDYHRTMENYAAAKAILFQSLPKDGCAIVNADDPASARMLQDCQARALRCTVRDARVDCRARIRSCGISRTQTTFEGPWGAIDVNLPLAGQHNVTNALQAAAVAHTMGLDADRIRDGLTTCSAPPGRLEPVRVPEDEFTVLVDYAHTDDALKNVLGALRPLVPDGAVLRVVFGCGGDRDRTKRPRMAAVACALADEAIITSDNPRTEEPGAIITEILAGVPAGRGDSVIVEPDRRAAITLAVERSRPGDVVLIAGKGHEDYQIVGREKRPFDDRLVAAEALRARCGSASSA